MRANMILTALHGRPPPMHEREIEGHGAGHGGIERLDAAADGQLQQNIAALARQVVQTLALRADDEAQRPAQVFFGFGVQQLTGLIQADDPHVLFLEAVDGLREVRLRDQQVLACASRGVDDRGCDLD